MRCMACNRSCNRGRTLGKAAVIGTKPSGLKSLAPPPLLRITCYASLCDLAVIVRWLRVTATTS